MPYQIVSNTNDITFKVNGQDALVVNKNGLITTPITTRQTVELGTVDSSGFSAFGGSTGSTTVTTATTLYLNAANGMVNRRGSITNPSWTGLSTNGTMYLYLDIASDGTCTSGSGTLAPVYQHGGTYSITSGQFTFNIQEMMGKVGNGASAVQTYRVYVGEVVVSANVVASIIWYALNGKYQSADTTFAYTTAYNFNTNIGVKQRNRILRFVNTITDGGFAVGDIIDAPSSSFETVGRGTQTASSSATSTNVVIGNVITLHKTTAAYFSITAASWKMQLIENRGNW